MNNSLFTHYLLEALRGQARTYGDGEIGVLDVFNFVAEKVPEKQPEQHPILKAEVETNFPIALHLGGQRHLRVSKTGPTVDNPKRLSLPPGTDTILKIMFDDCQRVVIVKEFGAGLSGSRIFMVRPILDEKTARLRTVVKLSSLSLIEKEWQAYQNCIRDRLPDAALIQGNPVLPPNNEWGGLCYSLQGGGGTFEIESLNNYLRQADVEDIRFVLGRLFRRLEQILQQSSPDFELHWHTSYDRTLPINLLIEPTATSGQAKLLSPDVYLDHSLNQGDRVRLEGFVITKVDLKHRSVTLNLPDSSSSTSFQLRLTPIERVGTDRIGQVLDPIEGVVIETRQEKLEAEVKRVLGAAFDPASETISWSGGPSLPNPLTIWPKILNEVCDVKVAYIHGDLNLENILVDPETRDVSLIDFADARRDHILHDFLRLETEVVTKIIPEILHRHHLPSETIYAFYRQLHTAFSYPGQATAPPNPVLEKPWEILLIVRKMASKYLWKQDDWTEYYQGLVLYLLGALRFKNLDEMDEAPAPLPKQVAFWGAATVMGLMGIMPPPPPVEKQLSDTSQVESWPTTLPWNEPYYQLPDRDTDIESIIQRLTKKEEQWGVFISGLGGIGKTATAIEIGRRCLATGAFERVLGDSAKLEFLVDGRVARADDRATLNFENFLNELGTQLDRPDIRLTPLEEKRHILQRLLNQAHYLVIVDNLETAENAEQIVRNLPSLLGRSHALITSRKFVSSATVSLKLEGLSEADSLFFLREDARVRQCDDISKVSDARLREVYQAVGGQPLALKLIVGQATNFGLDFALENVRNIKGDFYRFIYWDSWQKLSHTAQRVLIHLGRKPASISLKDLRYIFPGNTSEGFTEAIEQLINLSLVNVIPLEDEKRYSIHEITRRFINSDLPDLWRQQNTA